MTRLNEMKVQHILDDKSLATDEKIEALLEIESEARALQRAASESPMVDDDGWDGALRDVRKALDKLGWEEPAKGANSL
ncbi:hypothetical protein [Mesorhizobium denitrificans]|uniref:Uncharacterized protein n=1 Tax=Mesorhizobium denitrificans TaxID=2294114 RepID=A0A371XE16_9HYPH|nr:hypothetical protein [Mesorhizobium denitrificans]RFC67458.1 hypothetical protein DY251_10675 [Mesorhizobium denitrificans]